MEDFVGQWPTLIGQTNTLSELLKLILPGILESYSKYQDMGSRTREDISNIPMVGKYLNSLSGMIEDPLLQEGINASTLPLMGVIPLTYPKHAAKWVTGPPKQFKNSLSAAFRLGEREPVNRELLKETVLSFEGKGSSTDLVRANVPDNWMSVFETPSWIQNLPKKEIQKVAKIIANHETTHFWMEDPKLYKQVLDMFNKVHPDVRTVIKQQSIPPELYNRIMENLPSQEAKDLIMNKWVKEFLPYAQETAIYGEKAVSGIAKELAGLAKSNPEIMRALQETTKITSSSAKGAKKAIDALRESGAEYFLPEQDYLLSEIKKAIIDEQKKVISTSSKGIVKSRTASAREVTLEPKVRKTKEYIPTEKSKTVSIKPMYTGPKESTREFIDGIVKNIKDPATQAKARELIEKRLLGE